MGGATFAGCMMIMVGVWQVLTGIAAIARDGFFVVNDGYLYQFDTTAWGWIHLVIGALALIAGFFIFTGATWARAVGIGLAVISATAQFLWLPYQPLWSLLLIAIDVFVIWALASMGSAMRAEESPPPSAGRHREWSDEQRGRDFGSMNAPAPGGAEEMKERMHETGPVGQDLPPTTGGAGPVRLGPPNERRRGRGRSPAPPSCAQGRGGGPLVGWAAPPRRLWRPPVGCGTPRCRLPGTVTRWRRGWTVTGWGTQPARHPPY
jgi:hypothetical protein